MFINILKDWKNAVGNKRSALKTHEESVSHKDAVEKSTQFAAVCEGTKPNIYLSLSKAYHRHMKIK
jgi:hypothetical protein